MLAPLRSDQFKAPMRRESDSAAAEPAHSSKVNAVWQSLATRPIALQPKLAISNTGDSCEQEADHIADNVMRMAVPPSRDAKPITISEHSRAAHSSGEHGDANNGEALQGQKQGSADFDPFGASTAVHEVLSRPGQPLDSATRSFFEPRFGHNFGDVRVHPDGRAEDAARGIRAHAFTVGSHVVFGPGQHGAHAQQPTRLLAHELTHVVQQRSGKPMVARQTWGTANTTAPPAKNESPGDVFRGKLKDEVALFANAGAVLDWIVSERTAAGGATVTSFTSASLFADTATMKKLKPQPTSEADLLPMMEMLEFYEVVKSTAPGKWDIVLAPMQQGQTQQDVGRAKFDQNRKDIGAFQITFETRFDTQGHPIKQIAQQRLLEDSLAGGAAAEFKGQSDAKTNLAAVTAELDEFVAFRKKGPPIFRVTTDKPATATTKGTTSVLLPIAGQKYAMAVDEANFDHLEPIRTGTSPEVEARRQVIETRIKTAERTLFNAQGFHRFATEMVFFLHELSTTSSIRFQAGTYPRHGKFGEYAADMFPMINENSDGFYEIRKAEQFVDDINTVAEAGHPIWGKFAWQIVYNDATLQTKINAKYGGRMSSAPHHGPAPDKLHMHLDIRPLNVVADSDTGFGVNSRGRVILY